MGAISTIKKYKAIFVDRAGNNINYTTFVYAQDYNEAKERADDIMRSMNDDNLSRTIVVLISNRESSWSGIYR